MAKVDVFGNLVERYDRIKELSKQMLEIQSKIAFYSEGLVRNDVSGIDGLLKENYSGDKTEYYNNFLENFRLSCWNNILDSTKIASKVSISVKDDFTKLQQEQGVMAFTVENIVNLFESLIQNGANIMQKTVEESFDRMTKHYKENRNYTEGWKTNDRWKVNKKVILPNARNNWSDNPSLSYTMRDVIADIEKGLCFISGKDILNINRIEDVFRNDLSFGSWYDSEFFKFKMFKKGTLHIRFLDNYIYEQFNIVACKSKNWLGTDEKF